MPIRTRRWNDPTQPDDGARLLITRYRPRGVAKSDETWNEWLRDLAPSKELHALVYAKVGQGIPWSTYQQRYLTEMRPQKDLIQKLAHRVASGQTLTLLCSSACDRESRCHRSILKDLIEREIARLSIPKS